MMAANVFDATAQRVLARAPGKDFRFAAAAAAHAELESRQASKALLLAS